MKLGRTFLFLGVTMAALSAQASPLVIEGITIPDTRTVSGVEVKLNGAGVRTASVFAVKVWVGGFYTAKPITTPEEALNYAGPLRFDLHFLRTFNQEKTINAWYWQFKQSQDYKYPDMEKDIKNFCDAFKEIGKDGVESIEIDGDETRVYDNDVLGGTVKGRDFQKAFMSMWFGSKPVMTELKASFLGQAKRK